MKKLIIQVLFGAVWGITLGKLNLEVTDLSFWFLAVAGNALFVFVVNKD